jgi:hypothetical protein
VKGSSDVVKWAKSADLLLRKYDKQRSYNLEVLMKLQALERSIHVVCRISSFDAYENMAPSSGSGGGGGAHSDSVVAKQASKVICEVYGDREVGLLEGDGKWKPFAFDKVWGDDVDQSQVFKDVEVLLTSVVDGYCTCLIGVGDNSSGHRAATVFGAVQSSNVGDTDEGDGGDLEIELGLAYHSASALFKSVRSKDVKACFLSLNKKHI